MGNRPKKRRQAKKKSSKPNTPSSTKTPRRSNPFPATAADKKELAEDRRHLHQTAAQLAKAISKDENLDTRLRKYLADVKRYVRALERASKRYSSQKRRD